MRGKKNLSAQGTMGRGTRSSHAGALAIFRLLLFQLNLLEFPVGAFGAEKCNRNEGDKYRC